jgi:hypothetical protein
MPGRSVGALDIGILSRLAGLDTPQYYRLFATAINQSFSNVFSAIVQADGTGLAASFNDLP